MKVVNFWKTLFCAALAVTAFSACSDDDEEGGYSGMPEITVNGGESVTVAGKLEGGKLEQTVEVVSKGDWTLTFKNPGDSQWVTPSAMSGKTGTTQLTFTLGQASGERSAILVLTASSKVEGFPLTDEATITVVQSDSDVPTGNALYSENCGTKVEKVDGYWPYVDKFEGWTRGGSLDQKAVTYTGNSASVANSGKVFDPAEDETTVVTGPPYVSMNKSTSVFNINDINIASNTNFTFTFTAAQQINYSNGVVLGDMTDETIRFSVSTDGSSYAPVALKVKKVASGYWYLCTAEFKLPAGVSTDKIWVRFDGYAGLENHGLRIDDFKLYEGGNGSELVVPSVDYTKGTVAEAIAAGAGKNYEVAATVVAMHTQGILIGDASGVMLAFLGEAPAVAVNDAVTVKGTTELRNCVIQFGKEGLSVAKTGTGSYNTPAPEVMDGTAVTAYIATALENKAVYKYVKYNGEFTVSGNYYNVVIAGTTTKGSVAYGKSEWASFNGKPVTVEGWLLGGTANYLQTMATSVTVDSSTPIVEISAPQQFSLGAKTDNTIVVSAKGNNTDKTAYTANLVAKVAGATVATVALKQAAPTSGSGYAKIEKVADLKEGTGYLAGLVNGKYQTWTGVLTNKQCETVPYSYTEATGAFVADDAAGAEISLVAVSGVSNAYYIKYGEKYLTVGAAGKNQLVLADSAGDNYWTFTDDTDGVKATAKAFASIMMTSTGAASKYIRSYVTTNTSGVAGVVFFLAK